MNPRLAGFLALSLAGHGALLAIDGWRPRPAHTGATPALHVALLEAASPAAGTTAPRPDPDPGPRTAAPAPPTASANAPEKNQAASAQPAPTRIEAERHAGPPPHRAVPSSAEPAAQPPSRVADARSFPGPARSQPPAPPARSARAALPPAADVEALLQGRIEQDLSRHFFYPVLARRHGWEGDVLLAFRVEADGRIQNLRVAQSSGHGVLDRSALEALRKVDRVHGMSDRLGGRRFELELPVLYRLTEG